MKPQSYKGKSGYINPCVYMALFIPFIHGCYSVSDKIVKQPQKLTIIHKSSFDEPAPMSYISWPWEETRDEQFQKPVEFDVIGSVDLINWSLLYRTSNSNAFVPRLDNQFFQVGVHDKEP